MAGAKYSIFEALDPLGGVVPRTGVPLSNPALWKAGEYEQPNPYTRVAETRP